MEKSCFSPGEVARLELPVYRHGEGDPPTFSGRPRPRRFEMMLSRPLTGSPAARWVASPRRWCPGMIFTTPRRAGQPVAGSLPGHSHDAFTKPSTAKTWRKGVWLVYGALLVRHRGGGRQKTSRVTRLRRYLKQFCIFLPRLWSISLCIPE